MSKEEARNNVFYDTLKLLRLEAKKFGLMIELVESLAWQQVKEDRAPKKPTIEDRENLVDQIPWNFVANVDDYGSKSSMLRKINRAKFQQLKGSLAKIQKILEETVPK